MKKKTLFLGILAVFFMIVFTAGVFTLSLGALDNGHSGTGGRWAEVCCGSLCSGGQDYCMGSGTYTCCK